MRKLIATTAFLFFTIVGTAQIFSAQNGNWFNTTTWVGGVIPTENDDVVIQHTVTLNDSDPIRLARARSIEVSNLLDFSALLDLSNDAQLEVGTGGLQLNGLNTFNRGVRVRTQNNSLLAIDGNVTIVNNIIGVNTCRLNLLGNSSVVINGNLDFTYSPNDATADISSEISLGNTSELNVNGNVTLNYNSDSKGSLLSFLIDNDSEVVISGNLTLNVQRTTETLNDGIRLSLGANSTNSTATLHVQGSIELNTQAFDSPTTENEKNVLTVTDLTTLEIENDLIINYTGSNQIQDINRVQILSDGMALIIGDVIFIDNNFNTNNNVYLSARGTLELKGNIQNITQGYLQTNIDAAITTIIFSGNTPQQIPPITGRYENLVINNTAGVPLTLGGEVNVSRALTMQNGIINTGGVNNFIMTSTSSANEGNPQSYISGGLVKLGATNSFFPIGHENNWAPIQVNTNGGGNSNTRFEINYLTTASSTTAIDGTISHISGAEYWQVRLVPNPNNNNYGIPLNATLTFYYKDACWSEITNTNTLPSQDLVMARLPIGQTQWTAVPTIINALSDPCGVGTEQGSLSTNLTNAVNQYGDFTFASLTNNGNSLPVTWLDFYATEKQSEVELHWSTATEINTDYFQVQKSFDGSTWFDLSRAKAAGNSNQIQHYTLIDHITSELAYYRIQQFDSDGSSTFSKVIRFTSQKFNNNNCLAPNPWKLHDEVLLIKNDKVSKLEFYNATGSLMITHFLRQSFITNNEVNLPDGIYIVRLKDNENNLIGISRLLIIR